MTQGQGSQDDGGCEGYQDQDRHQHADGALSKLGATPVNVNSGDVYPALEKGVIDGAWFGLYTLKAYKLVDIVKYITLVDIASTSINGIFLNLMYGTSCPRIYWR